MAILKFSYHHPGFLFHFVRRSPPGAGYLRAAHRFGNETGKSIPTCSLEVGTRSVKQKLASVRSEIFVDGDKTVSAVFGGP